MEINNVAKGKPTVQSSTYHDDTGKNYDPDIAVDGQPNSVFDTCLFQHTDFPDIYPWWQVDLQGIHLVWNVSILNREDCCDDRLHELDIRVGLTPISHPAHKNKLYEKNPLCQHYSGAGIGAGEWAHFSCHFQPVIGRYVTIQIVQFCPTCKEPDHNILTMCEVRVFGIRV
ncbi:fucolectin-like [Limulus polyphemus]|uniref:Fucolectin-like n=1 Tax=Limulus polyphemus TaxID=6850 RepID=A0ABM1B1L5_LIMPO|nr:fucolectin-like [Limulus polyphemus]